MSFPVPSSVSVLCSQIHFCLSLLKSKQTNKQQKLLKLISTAWALLFLCITGCLHHSSSFGYILQRTMPTSTIGIRIFFCMGPPKHSAGSHHRFQIHPARTVHLYKQTCINEALVPSCYRPMCLAVESNHMLPSQMLGQMLGAKHMVSQVSLLSVL